MLFFFKVLCQVRSRPNTFISLSSDPPLTLKNEVPSLEESSLSE